MSVTAEAAAIRPFRIEVAEEQLVEFAASSRCDALAFRGAGRGSVAGVQVATVEALGRFWVMEHDWRETEAS
jgi:hypothetical protein